MSRAERIKVTHFTSDKAYERVRILHRVMLVGDRKARSRAIPVFFGLDPAPPSVRHARPPKRW